MSGMFSSKKESPSISTVYDPYANLRGQTSSWLQSQIGKEAKPYTGEMVAPLSEQENKSFDYLNKYINQGTPQGTALANEEVRKTMQGEYDPTSSPYYQAVKAEAAANLADTQSQINDQAAGGGRYWTGARLKAQGDALTDYGLGLNKTLYGMAEQERQNRLNTAPFAAQLGLQEQNQPLQQAEALQSLGGLSRNVDQARNEAVYNEWLRQQQYPVQIAQLASPYATQQPIFAQQGSQASMANQLSPAIGDIIGMLLSQYGQGKTGGTGGTSKISDWSSSGLSF